MPVARQRLDSTPQRTLGRFLAGAPLARHCRENPETGTAIITMRCILIAATVSCQHQLESFASPMTPY